MKSEWCHAGFHVGRSTGIMLELIWEQKEWSIIIRNNQENITSLDHMYTSLCGSQGMAKPSEHGTSASLLE